MAPPSLAQDNIARGPLPPFSFAMGRDPLPPALRTRLHGTSQLAQPEFQQPGPAMPDDVKQSLGCVITGTAATAIAVLAGGENLVNIIAGGVVTPQNPAVLYIGLVGVVFASFCAIGQALTPLYLYIAEDDAAPAPLSRSGLSRTRTDTPPLGRPLTTAGLAGGFATQIP